MGAGVVKPQNGEFHIHINTRNNNSSFGQQGQSSQQTSYTFVNVQPNQGRNSPMGCEACDVSFSVFKKKRVCKDCTRVFCSSCSEKLNPSNNSSSTQWQCKTCKTLIAGNFSRSDLLNWKVKDLKAPLIGHKVNTSGCKEKKDLIDLLISQFGRATSARMSTEEDRNRVQELAQRMREEHGQNSRGNSPRVNQNTSDSPRVVPETGPVLTDAERLRQAQECQEAEARLQAAEKEEAKNNVSENPHLKLADIKTESQIDDLTIKDLKRLLITNFVDYKGCVERWELQERVKRLWKENQKNLEKIEAQRRQEDNPDATSGSTSNTFTDEDNTCKICMDAQIDCVLLECGHMVTCTACGKRLSECPICRQYVVRAVHTFKS